MGFSRLCLWVDSVSPMMGTVPGNLLEGTGGETEVARRLRLCVRLPFCDALLCTLPLPACQCCLFCCLVCCLLCCQLCCLGCSRLRCLYCCLSCRQSCFCFCCLRCYVRVSALQSRSALSSASSSSLAAANVTA